MTGTSLKSTTRDGESICSKRQAMTDGELYRIIVVDSTRRGKSKLSPSPYNYHMTYPDLLLGMPDALSTTLPIWCTVLNLVLFPSHPSASRLFLPPSHTASTHAQISALLPEFVKSLKALNLDLPQCLTKPLRPVWVTPDSTLPDPEDADELVDSSTTAATIFDDFRPVICCTASRRVIGSEMDEGGYVQGAGDDTENWAHGLTPPVFWAHAEELLSTAESDLPARIARLVEQDKTTSEDGVLCKELTPYISVCPLPLEDHGHECRISLMPEVTSKEQWIKSQAYMEVGLGKSKTASRNLRVALSEICAFAAKFLSSHVSNAGEPGRIIIACESGKDTSVGVALAIWCYLFDDNGNFRVPEADVSFTKTLIKSRLGSIMTVFPEANPSRATLQSVNSFLMDWRK